MKPPAGSILVFVATCTFCAAVWTLAWPREKPHAAATIIADPPRPLSLYKNPSDLKKLLDELQSAPDNEARLRVAAKFNGLPVSLIPEALELSELSKEWRLTLVARILLVRWAAEDGKAAASWSWQHFRGQILWQDAMAEIGAAWAWHRPTELGNWILEREVRSSLTKAEAMTSGEPVLDFDMMGKIAASLIHQDPHMAYKVIQHRKGWSTLDGKLPEMLSTAAQARDALSAIDGLETMQPNGFRENEIYAQGILLRWYQLDPEGFMKSSFARFAPTLADTAGRDLMAAPEQQRETLANQLLDETSGQSRDKRMGSLVKSWAASDPAACGRWLDSLDTGEDPSLVATRTSVLAAHDPDAALKGIENQPPAARQGRLASVFETWDRAHPGQRPTGFETWNVSRARAWLDFEALRAAATPEDQAPLRDP